MYDYGIDEVMDLIDVAMKYGIIQKAGAWFNFVDLDTGEVITDETGKEIKLQGMPNVIDYLKNNDIMLNDIRERVLLLS